MDYKILETYDLTGNYFLHVEGGSRWYHAEYRIRGKESETVLTPYHTGSGFKHISNLVYFELIPHKCNFSNMVLKEGGLYYLRDGTPTPSLSMNSYEDLECWKANKNSSFCSIDFVTPPNIPPTIELIEVPEYLDETSQVIIKQKVSLFRQVDEKQGKEGNE